MKIYLVEKGGGYAPAEWAFSTKEKADAFVEKHMTDEERELRRTGYHYGWYQYDIELDKEY